MQFLSRSELLLASHASSLLFYVIGFSIHGFEEMIQQTGQEDHPTKLHCTFSYGSCEIWSVSGFFAYDIATQMKNHDGN